jgi:hypothetical protein
MEKWPGIIVSALADKVIALFFVFGVGFIGLGVTGGYGWLTISDAPNKVISLLVGLALVGVAIWLHMRTPSNYPKGSSLGLKIFGPREGDEVGVVTVHGALTKHPPSDYRLWVIRIYPERQNAMYPLVEARLLDDNKWIAESCDPGGVSGSRRRLGVYMVGPSGRALLRYFKDARSAHNRARRLVPEEKKDDADIFPLITECTQDMIMCADVFVVVRK